MEIDELLKNIDNLNEEIKEQYAVLGEQYFEKEFDNARANYSLVVNRITECKNNISDIRRQINFIKGIVICDRCGAEVKNTYTFCQECGNKIKDAIKEVPEGFVLCGNCNTVMEAGSKFCVCCGQRIDVSTQSSVKEPLQEPVTEVIEEVTLVKPDVEKKVVQSILPKRQKECPQCKGLINEDDTFCISCGAIFSIPEMDMDNLDDDIDDNKDENADTFRECPKCGQKISSRDAFCIRCGYRIV